MTTLNWLHLTDWHQRGDEFNRKVVRDALLKDIRERKKISPDLEFIDFIFFSGDVSYNGCLEEYRASIEQFFNPILNAAEVAVNRLIIVPGNHDVEWAALDLLPSSIHEKLDSHERVNEWLLDEQKRRILLEPMSCFRQFANEYLGKDILIPDPAYGYSRCFDIRGKKIAVLGINSAWLSGRHKETKDGKEIVNDYGHLIIGETQFYDLLQKEDFCKADLKIGVMHHPFDWLTNFDRQNVRDRLKKACHFILHGHEHQPDVRIETGTGGDCIVIPAGPSYDRREPEISRCANAYNFAHLDFNTGKGKVYLRRYDDRQGWIKDTSTTGDLHSWNVFN